MGFSKRKKTYLYFLVHTMVTNHQMLQMLCYINIQNHGDESTNLLYIMNSMLIGEGYKQS